MKKPRDFSRDDLEDGNFDDEDTLDLQETADLDLNDPDDAWDESADNEVPESRPLKSFSDRLVADYVLDLKGPEVLVLLMHGTTLASALRTARGDLNFTFYTPEHFFYRTLLQYHGDAAKQEDVAPECGGKTTLVCAADPPEQTYDEILFPTLSGDSSELAQDLLQAAHQRLRSGGRLIVSTNNPRDRWIQAQLRTLFSKVEVNKQKHGVACVATKSAPLKKIKGFRARSAFRLGERLVFCESRPGVFSHRRIDGGARSLIKSLALLKPDAGSPPFQPTKIIEMGCGSGAVSMAAALEYPAAKILAVDSDARAIECTRISASLNDITSVETLLTSDGVIPEPHSWDLLLGNPPYYSDYRIAELFLQTAKASLKPDGRIHLVTKLAEWHDARMKQLFRVVEAHPIGEYLVFTAQQR